MIVVDLTGQGGGNEPPRPRVLPCTKQTWCVLELEHEGSCEEKPRRPLPPSDFGPKRKPRS